MDGPCTLQSVTRGFIEEKYELQVGEDMVEQLMEFEDAKRDAKHKAVTILGEIIKVGCWGHGDKRVATLLAKDARTPRTTQASEAGTPKDPKMTIVRIIENKDARQDTLRRWVVEPYARHTKGSRKARCQAQTG